MATDSESPDPQLDMRGFVYVLTNPAMPGHVKIGQSRISPFDRATGLYTTGVPEPFRVARAWYVDNAFSSEQEIHAKLATKRSSGGAREFFSVSLVEAISEIEDVVSTRLVPEIYASSESSLSKLNSSLKRVQELEQLVSSLADQLSKEQDNSRQLRNTLRVLEGKMARYEEAYEKIGMIDKVIEERNRYRDRYQTAVSKVLEYAMEYEQFMLNLGGRYAFWAEEQSKKRPKV